MTHNRPDRRRRRVSRPRPRRLRQQVEHLEHVHRRHRQLGSGVSGYGGATSARASAAAPAGAVKLSADPTGALKFNVSTLHAKAGLVTLRMVDPSGSGVPHGISAQANGIDQDSKIVQPGGTATVTTTLKAGTYQFYCPVPGHEAAGMKGTSIVA